MSGPTTTDHPFNDGEMVSADEFDGFQGCPESDDPADPEHNATVKQAVIVEDGTLKLLLELKCSCGHERRRTIG